MGSFDAVGRTDERGFFLQDPAGDGDIATSDALFVIPSQAVAVGDAVRAEGVVQALSLPGELPLTRIAASSVVVESSGNALPAPVVPRPGRPNPPGR